MFLAISEGCKFKNFPEGAFPRIHIEILANNKYAPQCLILYTFLICFIGMVRSIGVSNFELNDLTVLQNIRRKELSVVQNWFDPIYTDDHVRNWCKENNVAYMGHR